MSLDRLYAAVEKLPEPYYDDGEGRIIYCGDCRTLLPLIEPGGIAIVTDPPYGIGHSSNRPGAPLRGRQIAGDNCTTVRDEALSLLSGRPFLVFGSWQYPPTHSPIRGVLIWDKGGHVGMGDLAFPWKQNWECIFVGGTGFSGRRNTGVLKYNAIAPWAGLITHPHQKPVALFCGLIYKCSHSIILDPFLGSGTTLRACKDLGRCGIGIEIEEKYCDIAANRLAQKVLF